MITIPKIDKNPQKKGLIEYPHVSTWDVFKEYIKLARPYWFFVAFILFGTILATLAGSTTIPTFYKRFFDTLTLVSNDPARDITGLTVIIFWILGIKVIEWIGWRMSWYTTPYVVSRVAADALEHAFDYTVEHSHSFFTNSFAGGLTQKMGRFSRSFEVLFDNIFYDLLILILRVTGALVVLYIANPPIAGLLAIWIIIFLIISFVFSSLKLKYDIEAANMNTKLTGALSDAISNHSSVQSFSGYAEEGRRVRAINRPFMHLNTFRWWFSSTLDAIQALLSLLIEFAVFYFGIKYWQLGHISLGTFVLAQAYIMTIGSSIWGFSRVVRNIYQGLADAKEMVEILHLKHEIMDIPGAQELKVPEGKIEYKKVGFKFGKKGEGKHIFDGISLSIKPGEKVAFIGSSGAGKSTLVKLLLRLHDIQEGEICIDGQNIKEVTQNSLRNNISLVPQDPALFHRTLMENIRYGRRDATDKEVIEAAKLAHCDEFINEFPQKYETYVGERGVKLSGGERQRVAIARAILKNAPILVLDEATSSLDSHSESLIQDALHTLMKGKTTIVIAHRLSTIRGMDRIIVVSKGGVVEEGSHDELIQKPGGVYSKLWSLQAGGFAGKSIEELLDV